MVALNGSLAVLPSAGGVPQALARVDSAAGEHNQWWPRVLADGRTVLYASMRGANVAASRIGVASLESGRTKVLDLAGTFPLGVLDGRLIYVSATGALMAVPFDVKRARVTGSPTELSDQVSLNPIGAANADLSPVGSLVYQIGASSAQVDLADAHGAPRVLITEARQYAFPRFSPDGKRIALTVGSGGRTDVWIYELGSGTLSRLTTEGTINERPEWSPDGKRVLFRTNRASGGNSLWWQPADGSGRAEPLVKGSGQDMYEGVLSPDGRTLAYRAGVAGEADLWYRRLDGDTTPKPVSTTPFTEWSQRLSPDGRWIAYASDESGGFQVYVRPFPGPGARYQVSLDFGEMPVWSRDGRRIFYLNGRQLMAATLALTPSFAVTARETLFEGDFFSSNRGHAMYDVAPDGKQFLVLKPVSGELQTVMVLDWRDELRARTRQSAPK